MITKEKKKENFIGMIYRLFGQFFATIFLFLLALLFVIFIGIILVFIYYVLALIKFALPVILGFLIGWLIVRWSR